MIGVRLTGMAILAEIVQPGCRKAAVDRCIAEMKARQAAAKTPAELEYESWLAALTPKEAE
jgi:hypothetical protein